MTLGTIISGIWGFVKGAATSIIKAVTSLNPTQALSAGLFVGGAIATVILGVRSLINRINSYRNRKNVSIVDSALLRITINKVNRKLILSLIALKRIISSTYSAVSIINHSREVSTVKMVSLQELSRI
jgi:hypothetical protein